MVLAIILTCNVTFTTTVNNAKVLGDHRLFLFYFFFRLQSGLQSFGKVQLSLKALNNGTRGEEKLKEKPSPSSIISFNLVRVVTGIRVIPSASTR